MPAREYPVFISETDRCELSAIAGSDRRGARAIRASVLLAWYNEGSGPLPLREVANRFLISATTVENIIKAYAEKGLDAFRIGKEPQVRFTYDEKRKIFDLSLSSPPGRRSRWPLRLLAEEAVLRGYVERISHSQVGRIIKEMSRISKNLFENEETVSTPEIVPQTGFDAEPPTLSDLDEGVESDSKLDGKKIKIRKRYGTISLPKRLIKEIHLWKKTFETLTGERWTLEDVILKFADSHYKQQPSFKEEFDCIAENNGSDFTYDERRKKGQRKKVSGRKSNLGYVIIDLEDRPIRLKIYPGKRIKGGGLPDYCHLPVNIRTDPEYPLIQPGKNIDYRELLRCPGTKYVRPMMTIGEVTIRTETGMKKYKIRSDSREKEFCTIEKKRVTLDSLKRKYSYAVKGCDQLQIHYYHGGQISYI